MALSPAAGDAALCYAHSLTGAERYLLGRLSEAEAEIEVALAYLGDSSDTWGHLISRFIVAHVFAEQGKPEAAREQLARLRRFGKLSGNDVGAPSLSALRSRGRARQG